MRATFRPTVLTLAVLFASAAWSPSGAQAPPAACSLMTKAEMEEFTGHQYTDPDQTPVTGGAGSVCTYDGGEAQIVVFSGPKSRELWDNYVKIWGHENDERHPVPEAGDGAYITYPKPRDKYEDTIGLIVVNTGPHTLGISLAAKEGQSAESVRPKLVSLTKTVVAKVR
jgi:hypothetical protein